MMSRVVDTPFDRAKYVLETCVRSADFLEHSLVACQFYREFHSKPHQPHPLFKGFIAAAHAHLHDKTL